MTQDEQPIIRTNPEAAGSEDPMASGEPDRDRQAASSPVPNTGRERKREHMAEHDAEGNVEKTPRRQHESIQHS